MDDLCWKLLGEWIHTYRNLVLLAAAASSDYVFITASGTNRNISDDVSNFFKRANKRITINRIRSIYRTEMNDCLNMEQRTILDLSDGHLPKTVADHYHKQSRIEQSKKADEMFMNCFGPLQLPKQDDNDVDVLMSEDNPAPPKTTASAAALDTAAVVVHVDDPLQKKHDSPPLPLLLPSDAAREILQYLLKNQKSFSSSATLEELD
jgi:hypothetical protein